SYRKLSIGNWSSPTGGCNGRFLWPWHSSASNCSSAFSSLMRPTPRLTLKQPPVPTPWSLPPPLPKESDNGMDDGTHHDVRGRHFLAPAGHSHCFLFFADQHPGRSVRARR